MLVETCNQYLVLKKPLVRLLLDSDCLLDLDLDLAWARNRLHDKINPRNAIPATTTRRRTNLSLGWSYDSAAALSIDISRSPFALIFCFCYVPWATSQLDFMLGINSSFKKGKILNWNSEGIVLSRDYQWLCIIAMTIVKFSVGCTIYLSGTIYFNGRHNIYNILSGGTKYLRNLVLGGLDIYNIWSGGTGDQMFRHTGSTFLRKPLPFCICLTGFRNLLELHRHWNARSTSRLLLSLPRHFETAGWQDTSLSAGNK